MKIESSLSMLNNRALNFDGGGTSSPINKCSCAAKKMPVPHARNNIDESEFRFDAMVKRRYTNTDRMRSLLESAVSQAMFKALSNWVSVNDDGVLIGSMALAYYARPRFTDDAEFLFRAVPRFMPDGFKKLSDHRFERRSADVVFNIYDGVHINISETWLDKIFKTSVISNGIKICSPIALVVLKLARFNRQDQADIESIVEQEQILLRDFDDWNLPNELIAKMQMFYS